MNKDELLEAKLQSGEAPNQQLPICSYPGVLYGVCEFYFYKDGKRLCEYTGSCQNKLSPNKPSKITICKVCRSKKVTVLHKCDDCGSTIDESNWRDVI